MPTYTLISSFSLCITPVFLLAEKVIVAFVLVGCIAGLHANISYLL